LMLAWIASSLRSSMEFIIKWGTSLLREIASLRSQ